MVRLLRDALLMHCCEGVACTSRYFRLIAKRGATGKGKLGKVLVAACSWLVTAKRWRRTATSTSIQTGSAFEFQSYDGRTSPAKAQSSKRPSSPHPHDVEANRPFCSGVVQMEGPAPPLAAALSHWYVFAFS